MPTLILTPRFTEDSQMLWRSARQLGWDVERLKTWRLPTRLQSVADPVFYVEALFGPSLAQEIGLALLEPAEDWLICLPYSYRKRQISMMSMAQAKQITQPAFIKPPNDKSFPARVYTGAQLPENYDDELSVLVSEVVSWEKEFRCFILNRQIQTTSIYLRGQRTQRENSFYASPSELKAAEAMVNAVLMDSSVEIPQAAVVDVGVIKGRGWAVVEMNSAWGAGIYGCNPRRVLNVLRHATVS